MAKKKAKSKKGRSRRRVGALSPSSPLVKIAAVVGGYVIGQKASDMIEKVNKGKLSPVIIGGVATGAGALLLLSKRPSLIKSVGGGLLAGVGVRKLKNVIMPTEPVVTTPPAVTGYGNVPVLGGYGNVPVLGNRTNTRMNGYNAGGTLGAYVMNSGRVMGAVDGSSRIGDN